MIFFVIRAVVAAGITSAKLSADYNQFTKTRNGFVCQISFTISCDLDFTLRPR